MPDKYENEKGVFIDVHTDKNGKDHIDIYDKDPKESDHGSIHINWDSESGKGTIVDTTDGEKETADVSCYLTSACIKHLKEDFNDNCEELTILRWFRDKFVKEEDIMHYYKTAPIIVDEINKLQDNTKIYEYIYENVVEACVKAIKEGNYDFAYNRYKSSILALEEKYVRNKIEERLINVLKLKAKTI